MALGCSHGALACPKALAAILKFKQSFKPDLTAHLGDAFDTTAFRSGARGTKDEAEPIDPDIASGLDFLEKLQPTVFLFGNHEDRLTSLASHPNAMQTNAPAVLAARRYATWSCDSVESV